MRVINRENDLLAKSGHLAFVVFLLGSCLLSVACQSKEQKAATALQRCEQLLDKGELQNIGDCYKAAMQADPDHAPEISKAGKIAFFKKCIDYKEKGDFKNAIICFEGFTELEPQLANNYFLLANSYYEYFQQDAKASGKRDLELLDRAEETIRTGLNIKPDDATAHSLYGEILKEKGDELKSLLEYQTATKISPKTGIFWIKLARAEEKISLNEKAISSYKQALNIDPNDKLALYFLGLLYERMGKLSDALETQEKNLKLEPSDEEIVQKVKELKERIESDKQNKSPKKKTKTVGSAVVTSN
jgi:tetratricopeptide (TPR) repeat protein